MIEPEIRQRLREWILARTKDKPAEFADDTPLLERGILSSIDIVELVLYIEQLRGEEVDVEALEPRAVHDVDAIFTTFFGAAS